MLKDDINDIAHGLDPQELINRYLGPLTSGLVTPFVIRTVDRKCCVQIHDKLYKIEGVGTEIFNQ